MPASERPSRQDLVVPPRTSNLPVVLGAAACGCVGFGLVWALGIGRPAVPVADPVATTEPSVDVGGDPPAAAPREPAFRDPAVEPASLDVPAPVETGRDRPLSRFSTSGFTPQPPVLDGGDATADHDPAAGDLQERSLAAPTTPDAPPPPQAFTPPPAPLALPPATELTAIDGGAGTGVEGGVPAPAADALEASDLDAPGGGPAPAQPAESASAARTQFLPPAAAADPEPAAPETAGPPDDAVNPPAGNPPAGVSPFPPPAPPAVAATSPPPARLPPAPARPTPPLPFAAAPPIVPGAGAPGGLETVPADSGLPNPPAGPSGQGRPGPIQLEGVQSPQLSVEKRGPREIQVGKPARYEILVRNVGSATANDVMLRDSVPYGTTLVTTTPPAAPGRATAGLASDELHWPLGTLPPGGQARVVIELMPLVEGEIGSVASVAFRAEASVRSRATKPALQITCDEPDPVLIGRDAGLTITVTNPGTGVATGVVLEGLLPENVSHRSGSELEFDVGQLKPGESRTIELVLGTRGPGVHAARLAARADGGIEVQQAVRLEVTAPTLELAVDMPVRRFLQRPATCTIEMVNAGTAPARSVELAAQLPPGLKFVRANNAGWHDERTNRVLWNLEELPPGETGKVEVVVMPVEHGPQKILAAARTADGLADQATHVCEVEGLAALFFEVADSEDPIEIGGVTEYVVRVGNQGTASATGVRLTAALLGDLEPVEAQGPAGHRIENLAIAFEPLAKLAPSEEAVFRIRARGRTQGDHRVQVQLVSEDHPTPITKEEITRVYADR